MSVTDPRKTRHEAGILQQRLRRHVGRAIADFNMIEDGDRVMVCLSGGKDSYAMLDILQRAAPQRAPVQFRAHRGPPRPEAARLPARGAWPNYLATTRHSSIVILEQDTYSVVKRRHPGRRTMCGLCSRMRRGALYRYAAENGITKVALGHHRDDIVETLFLNLFFGGKLKAMAAQAAFRATGKHVVIRPLAYVRRARYRTPMPPRASFPIIPCNLCGSQETCSGSRSSRPCWPPGTASTRAASRTSSAACMAVRAFPARRPARCSISVRWAPTQSTACPMPAPGS
jgi:tRNA 2-thiocytidine biosynthesis protein TtcA